MKEPKIRLRGGNFVRHNMDFFGLSYFRIRLAVESMEGSFRAVLNPRSVRKIVPPREPRKWRKR